MRMALLALAVLAAAPVRAQTLDAPALMARFMAAWDARNAKGLADLFAVDADFVSPFGVAARGRDQIAAFYGAVFAKGYAGSHGSGEIVSVRALAPDTAIIDSRWQIEGAKNADGTPQPIEKGILAAVIGRVGGEWKILALRENEGAADLQPLR